MYYLKIRILQKAKIIICKDFLNWIKTEIKTRVTCKNGYLILWYGTYECGVTTIFF